MDVLAGEAGADPVEYRLRHLKDPRLIEVVKAAASTAGWEGMPRGSGRGIACVLYEGNNGYCAMVAQVDVDRESGVVGVKRLVIANDSGPVSNPDGLRNQLEGGALHGLSRTLFEEVTWDDEKVTSVDWRTYRPLYLGAVPRIETVLINRTDVAAMGAGETAVTLVAAAVGNAIFDATGVRLTQVPFTPERVRAAMVRR
jgi:CO/xanthine dehydrogenase Mo-binding subunit